LLVAIPLSWLLLATMMERRRASLSIPAEPSGS
jgi:hypothetical protein